jgi:hypothetical protein
MNKFRIKETYFVHIPRYTIQKRQLFLFWKELPRYKSDSPYYANKNHAMFIRKYCEDAGAATHVDMPLVQKMADHQWNYYAGCLDACSPGYMDEEGWVERGWVADNNKIYGDNR